MENNTSKKMLIGYNTFDNHCLHNDLDYYKPAERSGGVDFILCHFSLENDPLDQQCEKARQVAKKLKEISNDFIANFETQNFAYEKVTADGHDWANRPDGSHRLNLPKEFVDALKSEGNLAGVMHDEFEHVIINRNLSVALEHKVDKPVFPTADTTDVLEQGAKLEEQLREYAAEIKALGAPAFAGEHVFPVLFHLFARCGIIPNFKSQKESFSNVQFAVAAGAALQYHTPLWNCVDLWYRMTFPGHSPNELYHNLMFAYYMGVNRVYVEASSALVSKDKNGVEYFNEHGNAFSRFVSEYRGKDRSYDVQDYRPEIAIIRYDDSFWGQGKSFNVWKNMLLGNPKVKPDRRAKEWIKAFNLITHGETGNGGLSWDKVELHALTRHRSFASMNGAVVFDENVEKPLLSSLKLCFLCGYYISEKTLQAVRETVQENGLVVVTAPRFLPDDLKAKVNSDYCELLDGEGRWIVTNDLKSARLKRSIHPFLGNKGEMTYRFADKTLRMKITEKGDSFVLLD